MLNRITAFLRLRQSPKPKQNSNDRTLSSQGGIENISGELAKQKTSRRMSLEDTLEKRATQLELINDISERIAAATKQDTVINRASQLIQQTFGYDRVTIFTPMEESDSLILRSGYSASEGPITDSQMIKPGQGMVGLVAENKTSIRENNLLIESHPGSFSEKAPTRSEMTLPILKGEKIIGVLDIQSPLINAFDEDDERVIKMIAGQIAVAMENARLYEELHNQLRERERRENILRIQRDLLVRLNTARTLKETLKTTLDVLSSELNVSRAVVSLVDRETQRLIHGASFTNSLEKTGLAALLVNPEIAESVARTAMPMIFQDTRPTKSIFSPTHPTIIYIPLIHDKKVIGVITLESATGSVFSQEDITGVSNLANSLVMLIERARLFEELQKARSELEIRAEELEKANANLLELDKLKSQFLMNISHELRTPLNSIIGFSEVLLDNLLGPLNDEQREYNQDILTSGRYLLEIINNLLDFSKATAEKMDLRISSFSVEKLFTELHNAILPIIAKKSQNLMFYQDPHLPMLKADYLRIKQVFFNLISNANKFTPNYGSIQISCRMVKPGVFLFEVKDSGIGIRAEDHEIIFEEFRQVDGSMTREVPGTGLGLTISRRIVELHHGKIWVESEFGRGATFFVMLPMDPDSSL